MSNLRTIIVDDEPIARWGLSLRLQHVPQVDVIAQCSNGEEALIAITERSPALVFLDIQMPGMNSFEVISALQSDVMPMIIFVTAYNECTLVVTDKTAALTKSFTAAPGCRHWESRGTQIRALS